MVICAKSIWPVTGQSEVKSAVSKRMRYCRRAGFGNVSSRASAGDEGNRASLLPSNVSPAAFFRFATLTLNAFAIAASIAFDHEQERGHDYEGPTQSGWRNIGLARARSRSPGLL